MIFNGPVTAFLPCRMGSERVPKKNIRPFGTFSSGLVEIKLQQLLSAQEIDRVVLSTNDAEIISFAEKIDHRAKLFVHKRAEELSSSQTSTDSLVAHARSLIGSGHILWTHVTSPFVSAMAYDEAVVAYKKALENGHDSLMTTSVLRSFIWTQEGPINYDRTVEKWPRTQTLPALHEVNSAVFLAHCDVYEHCSDRIGNNPYLMPLDKVTAFDIDWEDDFRLAEQMLLSGVVSI